MLSVACVNCHRDVHAEDLDELAGLAVRRVFKTVVDVPRANRRAADDDLTELESHGPISTPPEFSVRVTDINQSTRFW
ncbi:hypothetical protein WME76_32655 [Sorangium sp. So ce119]|uniref:hypothetical protein n=1 Tax=Sorangium sp. So ce119 TaxID=3133279 RepID=UPI003F623F4B